MPKYKSLIFVLVLLIMASIACEGSNESNSDPSYSTIPTPANPLLKADRILELDANPPENEDYDQVIENARGLGAESIRLSVYWDDMETAPGVFNPDPNWLAIANQYYPAQELSISLTISVLDTTEIRLPDDLVGRSLSDQEVIDRFISLLDYIQTQLVDVNLVYLAIGNEIDGVLGNDPQDWQQFSIFFESTAAHARQIWPDLPISTKVTFEGLFNASGPYAKDIYRGSDVVMTTYYPLQGDFSVKDPDVVLEDFQVLAALFPDKEIQITEIGYPSSTENDSTEEKQAEFIHHMFEAWDKHQDQITLLSYSWLSDLAPDSVRELESYYGLKDQGFAEFLRTLGLRTYSGAGENKIGYETFQNEASLRGW